jgi:DUF3014 family protein
MEIGGYEPKRRRSRLVPWLIVLVLLAGAGVLAYRFWPHRQIEAPPPAVPTEVAAKPTPRRVPTPLPTEPPIPLPALDQSDSFIRKLVAALSSRPEWVKWLATEGLIHHFVVSVDNVAEGATPKKQVPFLAPKEKFAVVERRGSFYVAPKSYKRYDVLAEVIASLDTKGTAKSYRQLKPLIKDAYRELGYPDRDFDVTLARAIDRLLATPIPRGEVELRQGVKSYRLADPALEKLTPAQKQLLRMGPENMKKVQDKLRALRESLALPPAR